MRHLLCLDEMSPIHIGEVCRFLAEECKPPRGCLKPYGVMTILDFSSKTRHYKTNCCTKNQYGVQLTKIMTKNILNLNKAKQTFIMKYQNDALQSKTSDCKPETWQ